MRISILLVALEVLIVPAACKSGKGGAPPAGPCPRGMTPAAGWVRSDVLGYHMRLVDPDRMMEFSFGDSEMAMASLGRRRLFTSPALKWEIDKDGLLRIGNHDDLYTLQKVCAGDGGFTAKMGLTRFGGHPRSVKSA